MASSDVKTVEALVDDALVLGEGLNRPLRYVQLNSFYNGSTGSIMRGLHAQLSNCGVDSYCFWGRRHATIDGHMQCCATKPEVYLHGAMTRLRDRMGFYSKRDTVRLLKRLDEIDPDVVHLHNIHGYYVNIEMLFAWLAAHRCQVRWTLHDCWALTGHCAYFTYVKCAQWMTHCAYSESCPQPDAYPKTICKSNCARNFEDKRRIFTSVPPERMTLICPSQWLADLVAKSFLKGYPVEVRHNTIDKAVFKPTPSDFRERYGIGDRFMILGVASPWTERKGLGDFVRLAGELDSDRYAIVLVGLSAKQMKSLPVGIIGLTRTDSPQELAGIYTTADVFFNPTVEDNYPTVNLEAEACGTPVITYDTGGCRETIADVRSHVVEGYSQAVELLKGKENHAAS
ncbi:glycosyltransferase [Collinsella stercoris]|uniref:glycosyltransferase n=1 Tax=Collinsella stercoris TaxID=147206 RepID=UPI0026EB6C20|nr:glycosyltransferase [Collinsella stercoris]MBS6554809.1 glycosyltransferase [Collinsella stercoris]